MDTATSRQTISFSGWPLAALWLLPLALVLLDHISAVAPVDRIWFVPLPVVLLQSAAIVYAIALSWRDAAAGTRAMPPWPSASRVALLSGAALFAWAAAATVLFGPMPNYGFTKLMDLALCWALALSVAVLLRRAGKGAAEATLWALFGAVLLALPVQTALRAILPLWEPETPTLMEGFVHIRVFGFALAFALSAGIGLWATAGSRSRHTAAAILVGLTMLWTALFWSGSRGALLALLTALLVLACVLPALRRTLPVAISTLIAGAALSIFLGDGKTGDFGLAARLATSATAESAEALSSGRIGLWTAAIEAANERPFTGHGYAQANAVFREAGLDVPHVHAHSIVLDAALALGWGGMAMLAALALWTWVRWVLRARRNGGPVQAAAALAVTVFLALALVDGLYFYHQALIPLAVAAGILIARPADQAD